jgi:AbrB family looped-hinge helix DNA binding protein
MATTVTVKGQVTIPKQVREAAGIKPGDRVEVSAEPGKGVVISRLDEETYEERLAANLERIRNVARNSRFSGFTTDELMALTRGED